MAPPTQMPPTAPPAAAVSPVSGLWFPLPCVYCLILGPQHTNSPLATAPTHPQQSKPTRPLSGDYATIDETKIQTPPKPTMPPPKPAGAPPKPTGAPPKPTDGPPPKPAAAPPPKPNAPPPPKPGGPPSQAAPRATPASPPPQQAYFEEVGPQQNLPPVQGTGYCDNFWNDKGGKTGFDILVLKHRNGKEVLKDLAEYVLIALTERVRWVREY